ncbi:EKC/KEOPS complex subunit like protein [Verticillium longisporum]|nr:EKC/KEOPS complex subunit like protein [Verticillium longisporum]
MPDRKTTFVTSPVKASAGRFTGRPVGIVRGARGVVVAVEAAQSVAKRTLGLFGELIEGSTMLDTIALDLVPADHQVHVALFRGVQNAGFLHSQLLARNAAFEYAFIDASVVASRTQILAAAFRALAAKLSDNLKTPNVHSELVTSLSPSNNIADAYRRFGISPATKDLVVVKITYPSDSASTPVSRDAIEKHLAENVEGTPAEFSDDELAVSTDWTKVKKYYKLNGLPWLDAIKDEQERKLQMDELVLGAMALRGV